MDGKDDLDSVFADDELRRSIEAADGTGVWRDPGAKFVDPKVKALAEKLARAPSTTYTERRLAELDKRAAAKVPAPAAPKSAFEAPFAPAPPLPPATSKAPVEDWRETIVPPKLGPVPPLPLPATTLPPGLATPQQGMDWLFATLAAAIVFGSAAAAQGIAAGFTTTLLLRATIASAVAAAAWSFFPSGRFYCIAIGTVTHLVAFLATADSPSRTEVFGIFLGMMIVLLGSGVVGFMREGRDQNRR